MNWTFWTRTRPAEPDDCETIDPLLSLYADGMASPEEVSRVDAHLPGCAACRESLVWMRATRFALSSRPVESPPAHLRARIAAAIAASSDAPVPVSFNVRRAFSVRPAYAAAASVAVLGILGYGLLYHPQPVAVHPAPPMVAVKPLANNSTPVIKPMPGFSIKPHLTSHPAPVAKHTRLDPDLVAQNQPHEAVPEPVVKTHVQPKPDTKMLAEVAPIIAPLKPHLATIKKTAPRKFHAELLATNKGLTPSVETHKAPVIAPEPKKTDTIVAEAPHPQVPAFIEKQPIITQDPVPTVAVASSGAGRLQTAEEHGVIKVHLAMQMFAHQTLNRVDSGSNRIGYIPFVSTP